MSPSVSITGFGIVPRKVMVSVSLATPISTKSSFPVLSSISRHSEAAPGFRPLEAALIGIAAPQFQYAAHRYRERHVHRIGTDNSRQRAVVGPTTFPIGNRRPTDAAIDWRSDFGVAEIDLRLMKLSFRRLHLRRRNALRCQRAINCDLGSGLFCNSSCARDSVRSAFSSCALAWATAASLTSTSASNGARSRRYRIWPVLTSAPSLKRRSFKNAVTRATRSTRWRASMRPLIRCFCHRLELGLDNSDRRRGGGNYL